MLAQNFYTNRGHRLDLPQVTREMGPVDLFFFSKMEACLPTVPIYRTQYTVPTCLPALRVTFPGCSASLSTQIATAANYRGYESQRADAGPYDSGLIINS